MDEQDQTAITPEEPGGTTQTADVSPTGADALTAFITSGGTFGMAVRDGLAQAQLQASGAAKMSGEHISNLIYGLSNVNEHTAPYTGRAYPNPNDYRERETNTASRRRRR